MWIEKEWLILLTEYRINRVLKFLKHLENFTRMQMILKDKENL